MFGRTKKAAPAQRVDAHTGLPELPEGYFWKVGPKEGYVYSWGDAYKDFGISIRSTFQRKPLYQSHEQIADDVALNIHVQANVLAEKFYADRKTVADRAALAGEYPPKRMP